MQDIRVTAVQKPSQTTAPVFVVVTPQNRPDKIGRSERVGLRIYDEHSGAQHPTTETAAKPHSTHAQKVDVTRPERIIELRDRRIYIGVHAHFNQIGYQPGQMRAKIDDARVQELIEKVKVVATEHNFQIVQMIEPVVTPHRGQKIEQRIDDPRQIHVDT